MNGVVPVVVVIGGDSVPAAVVRLQRVMGPALAGIGIGYRNSLTSEAQCPHIRRVRVLNAWLNRRGLLRLRRRLDNSVGLGQGIVNDRIAFHACYVRPGGQLSRRPPDCLLPGSHSQCRRNDARCRARATIAE